MVGQANIKSILMPHYRWGTLSLVGTGPTWPHPPAAPRFEMWGKLSAYVSICYLAAYLFFASLRFNNWDLEIIIYHFAIQLF